MTEINKVSLLTALSNLLNTEIRDAQYSSEVLQGGTVGDVQRISGEALDGRNRYPFSLVLKTQQKWNRYGDPDCWRREYSIYKQGLANELPQALKLPRCCFLEEDNERTQIWMEFIEGKTGANQLHAPELALAAQRLGEFQAWFHLHGKRDLPYLRSYPAIHSSYALWWDRMKSVLNQPIEGFPDEVRFALLDYVPRSSDLLESFHMLPLTLCQGDVHHDNLIFKELPEKTDVYLIDWDCAGYGYMGEDAVDVLMEAFVYSDRDISLLPDYKQKIISGYCDGVKTKGVNFAMSNSLLRDMFALAWGFRIADHYLYNKDPLLKKRLVDILQTMLMEEIPNV